MQHRSRHGSHLGNWCLAAAACALILAAQLLDEPDPSQALADDAAHAAQLESLDRRIQRTAEAVCLTEAGPGAQVLWTHQGDLVCRPQSHTVAQGGQP